MTQLAAAVLLPFSVALSVWYFRGIVHRYRTLHGFPWLLSVCFAAASTVAILVLHVLLNP